MKRNWSRRRLSACDRWWGWALALSLCVSGATPSAAEPVELNNARLSIFTAGSPPVLDFALDDGATSNPISGDDQAQRPATGVFVSNTSGVTSSRGEVRLAGDTQSQLTASAMTNASVADVANGSNVFDLGASGGLDKSLFRIDQENQIIQTTATTGSLGYFTTLGPLRESEFQNQHSFSSSSTLQMRDELRDRHVKLTSITRTIDAEVIPDRLGLGEDLSLGQKTIVFPDFGLEFAGFTIPLIDLPGDLFDVKIVVPGSSLTVTGAKLGAELVLDGPDVILKNPTFTLPGLKLTICCDIGGNDVDINIPGLALPPIADISLKGLNPLKDVGFDYGYAVLGDGSIGVTAGGIVVDGVIPIDLNALLALLPPPVIPVVIFGVHLFDIPLILPPLNLPTLALNVGFSADFPLPDGLNQEFGGDNCHLVSTTSGHCTVTVLRTVEEQYDGYESVTSYSLDTFQESHLSAYTEHELGEVTVEGAEAKFIVLRNSELQSESYKVVVVNENAQSSLRALHAVNAVGAIVGNGFNATRTRALGGIHSSASVTQLNTFVQIGGL